jgi:hypothetical protein
MAASILDRIWDGRQAASNAEREATGAIGCVVAVLTACWWPPVEGRAGGIGLCRRWRGTHRRGAGHRETPPSMPHGSSANCSGWPACLAVARTATASSIPRLAVPVSGIA